VSHSLGHANLPMGEHRRGVVQPASSAVATGQRSSPARHAQAIPQVGSGRREWSLPEPTVPFHNTYWKSVSTASFRVPPTAADDPQNSNASGSVAYLKIPASRWDHNFVVLDVNDAPAGSLTIDHMQGQE
jgi:hypothetical protein